MNKGKFILRIVYSLVASIVVCILLYEFHSNGAVDFPKYVVCMTPMCLLLVFNWFNTIMYAKYCIDHNDEKVGFINKDTSKFRKAIRSIILSLVAVSMLSIFITLCNVNKSETYKEKTGFISERMTFDSCTDVDGNTIQPTMAFTLEEQFDYLWYYSSEGRYVVSDKKSKEVLCEARIEYVERLPKFCSKIVSDELYKDAIERHSYSEKVNVIEGETTYNDFNIKYVFFSEDNLIYLFAGNNNTCFCVAEKWDANISIDIEQRIYDWENVIGFKCTYITD